MNIILEKVEFKALLPELVVYILTDTFLSKVFERFTYGQAPVTEHFVVRQNTVNGLRLTAKGQVAKHLAMEIMLKAYSAGTNVVITLTPTGGDLEPAGRNGHIVGYFKTDIEIWLTKPPTEFLTEIKEHLSSCRKTHIDYNENYKEKQARALLELIKPYL